MGGLLLWGVLILWWVLYFSKCQIHAIKCAADMWRVIVSQAELR